jgi:hypothetical protein
MQRHAAPCNSPTALERSLHIERWEGNQNKTPEKTQPEQTTAQPRTNIQFIHIAPPTKSRPQARSQKYEKVPVQACQPVRSLVINRSTHGPKSRCGFKHIALRSETACAATQRLRTHAADTAACLAHARLALSAAPAGRRPLANAEGANAATATSSTTRRLGCACGRRHALFHGQLKLVDRGGVHVLSITRVREAIPLGGSRGCGCA